MTDGHIFLDSNDFYIDVLRIPPMNRVPKYEYAALMTRPTHQRVETTNGRLKGQRRKGGQLQCYTVYAVIFNHCLVLIHPLLNYKYNHML